MPFLSLDANNIYDNFTSCTHRHILFDVTCPAYVVHIIYRWQENIVVPSCRGTKIWKTWRTKRPSRRSRQLKRGSYFWWENVPRGMSPRPRLPHRIIPYLHCHVSQSCLSSSFPFLESSLSREKEIDLPTTSLKMDCETTIIFDENKNIVGFTREPKWKKRSRNLSSSFSPQFRVLVSSSFDKNAKNNQAYVSKKMHKQLALQCGFISFLASRVHVHVQKQAQSLRD